MYSGIGEAIAASFDERTGVSSEFGSNENTSQMSSIIGAKPKKLKIRVITYD